MKKYAISDIHGCHQTFQALLEKIDLQKEDELFLLGDYIDRGPDSKGVIDTIWEMQQVGYQIKCLRGNHEQMLLDAFEGVPYMRTFLRNGGIATIKSFGIDKVHQIPTKYLNWMDDLPFYLETEGYFLVHAGLDFTEAEPLTDLEGMVWIRDWYRDIDYNWLDGRIIIHGHTPTHKDVITDMAARIEENQVLNIDGGAVFNPRKHYHYGYLVAFDLIEKQLVFQENVEE